jgi:hypothetical protein
MDDIAPPPGFEADTPPPGLEAPTASQTSQAGANRTNTGKGNNVPKAKNPTPANRVPNTQRNKPSSSNPRNNPGPSKAPNARNKANPTNTGRKQPPKKDNEVSKGRTELNDSHLAAKADDIQSFGRETKVETHTEVVEEGHEMCLTCCNPIRYFAVGMCNHRSICSLCVIRMRSLYGETECPLCKVD